MIRAGSLFVVIVSAMMALRPCAAGAQTAPVVGAYVAGWNMAGAPDGTSLAPATTVDAWNGSGYTSQGSQTTACVGYWAYYSDPATVTLNPTAAGPTRSCALLAGWNLLGNPFAGAALLPDGLSGYYWNPDRGAYDVVSTIPPGGAVWIYLSAPSTVTLTYQPVRTRIPTTLGISFLGGGPYTVHVGDSIKLELPSATPQTATTDPRFLHLEAAGTSGDLSCLGASCGLDLADQFWTWHAIAAGTTSILVTPVCAPGIACAAPTTITIAILP